MSNVVLKKTLMEQYKELKPKGHREEKTLTHKDMKFVIWPDYKNDCIAYTMPNRTTLDSDRMVDVIDNIIHYIENE